MAAYALWASARSDAIVRIKYGEMAEWLKAHAWKACIGLKPYRGFESPSLRTSNYVRLGFEPVRAKASTYNTANPPLSDFVLSKAQNKIAAPKPVG
jgi:hypothetical protein